MHPVALPATQDEAALRRTTPAGAELKAPPTHRTKTDLATARATQPTAAEAAARSAVALARISRIEKGQLEKSEVETLAAYVKALGGKLKIIADFGDESYVLDCPGTRNRWVQTTSKRPPLCSRDGL